VESRFDPASVGLDVQAGRPRRSAQGAALRLSRPTLNGRHEHGWVFGETLEHLVETFDKAKAAPSDR